MVFSMKLLRMYTTVMSLLGVLAFTELSLAIEIQIADQEAKDGKGLARLELRDAKSIKSNLLKFRIKTPYSCPRSGFTAEEQQQAIREAKDIYVKSKKKANAYSAKKDYLAMTTAWQGCNYATDVIAAFGSLEDAEWVHKNVKGRKSTQAIGQIYLRHGKKLSDFNDDSALKWPLAVNLAQAKDKEALDYLVARAKTDEKINLHGVMDLLMKRGHPEATAVAKEVVDDYLKALAEGTLPNSHYSTNRVLPFAIIQLAIDPQAGEDYQKKIDGIVISETVMRAPILLISVKDPRPVFDMFFGRIGKMGSWDESRVKWFDWHTKSLYAATAGRNSADVAMITKHYKNLVYNAALRLKAMGNTHERAVGILTNQIMDVNTSGLRLSGRAASLCQSYDDSVRTSFRFRFTPWIKMQWMPETVLPFVGSKQRSGLSEDRLSPFSNESLVTLAATYKDVDPDVQRGFLLHHKMINKSFISPHPAPLGAVRNAAVRLSGSQPGVAAHTIIQVVTPRNKDKLIIGFKIRSIHHDGGGLASAIDSNHLKLRKLSDDHCKSQVSNVRSETTAGKVVKLDFVKTTDSGIQLYQCAMPSSGVRDLYLHYDWTPMDDSYPLVHALYEPWFALLK